MSVHADAPPPVVSDPSGLQYATGRQLGKGGFAICHHAELLEKGNRTGNIIALKIVKSKMEPPKLAQKFVTELQIHSKLLHPNIVEFYRAFSFELNTYVVLELCENGSLADAIKKRKYFTMPEIRRFMIQTCGAIKYLHHRNIVHRDLKTGNLFLDKDMNVKVGDFGLAALLVSQHDMQAIRRMTMCGTPNYLAPEVLERAGHGHNEKVDIWAIGIMMYTLAVGRAPFHAAKREDIYKKLKDGEYKWPDLSKFQNEISAELREVVSSLLVPENDRPNPDKIVSHDFFKMNYIPLELSSKCTTVVPRWPTVRPPSPATVRRGYTEEWHKLCKESGVGEYEPGKTFTVFGGRKVRSVAKDCQKEIDLQKQPAMPFDKGVVYLPFPERAPWPARTAVGLSEIAEEKESSSEGPALVETTGNDRARENPPRLVRAEEDLPKENIEPEEPEPVRRLAEKPTRMRTLRKISNPDRVTAGTAPVRTIRYPRAVQRTRSTREATKANEELQVEVKGFTRSQAVGSNEPRRQPQPQAQPTPIIDLTTPESENLMIPFTDPTMVLMRISKFRDNVARALTSRSRPPIRPSSPHLPFVSKWVDYSRKHGVGYVLEEGSIGCLLNATSKHPVTHVVARDGHTCLGNVARDITRVEQAPLEYYTDFGGKGLRVAPISKDRRKMINTIWSKFGKYMCQQLGTADGRPTMPSSSMQTSFVKFYQRLGNVGVWGFGDGSFQFNFPDHTKLVFSADGEYCQFNCLTLDATQHMAEYGDIPFKYIRNREILKSSLHILMHGTSSMAMSYRKITEANLLEKKLRFIVTLMDQWVAGGGLGVTSDPSKLTWDGPQLEDSKKQDWVTVGRYGGDKNN